MTYLNFIIPLMASMYIQQVFEPDNPSKQTNKPKLGQSLIVLFYNAQLCNFSLLFALSNFTPKIIIFYATGQTHKNNPKMKK